MSYLIVLSLIGSAVAAPEGFASFGGSGGSGGYGGGGGSTHGVSGGYNAIPCSSGLVADASGNCVEPIVTRNIFSYAAPEVSPQYLPTPQVPKPRVEYNVVFVRTPEQPDDLEPIVVPPPQQKTLVYVLNKQGSLEQQVIEVPAGPGQQPEVFYVNYKDGDNPSLKGGVTLQEILRQGAEQGGVIGGGGYGGGSSGGFSGSSGGSGGYGGGSVGFSSSSSGGYGGGSSGFSSSSGGYE